MNPRLIIGTDDEGVCGVQIVGSATLAELTFMAKTLEMFVTKMMGTKSPEPEKETTKPVHLRPVS